jgi:nucleotide-binding universal stress UspA family protein
MKGEKTMADDRRILIAVNGSKDVLVQGLKLIGSETSMVTVVTVNPPYEGDLNLIGVQDIEHCLDGGAARTVSEINKLAKSLGIAVKVRIEEGEIVNKIVEVAEEEKSDLIIMGAGSQNSLKKFFLGNLLDEVTHQAPCPVLVVQDREVYQHNYIYHFSENMI